MNYIYFDLYILSQSLDFKEGSSEHDVMTVANCPKINKNNTYNAILLCDDFCLYGGRNDKTNKILNLIDKCKCHIDTIP